MASRADQDGVHFVTRGINLKSVASTTIAPSSRTSRRFIVHKVYLVITAGSGVSVGPTVRCSSVGNSGSAGDVCGAVTATTLNANGITDIGTAGTQYAWSLAAGTGSINLDVTTGATATSMTGEVHVLGYFT